jgi:peptidoglycan/xylan/chitin deacetylase (PgdA/CDA1 family)
MLRRALLALPFSAPAAQAGALVEPTLHIPPPAVALTLDLCPGGFDERLYRGLVQAGIRATWFLTGDWLRRNPAALALLLQHRDLFAFANHGDRHLLAAPGSAPLFGQRAVADAAALRAEVLNGAALVEDTTGTLPRWYRGATGCYSRDAITQIEAMGCAVAGYSINADAGASLGAAAVTARVLSARPGDVLVAHGNQPHRPAGQGLLAGVQALQRQSMPFAWLG